MEQLNINDTMSIMNYGVNVQNKMSDLSACAYDIIKNIDLKDIGDLLSSMLTFFKDEKMSERSYTQNEALIDKMSDQLKQCRIELLMDCEMFDQLCVMNRTYISEITALIENARHVVEEMIEETLSADQKMKLSTLEKRIKELEMSQTVAYSFEPQVKVVAENEAQMAERIQSALVNALALWKRQQIVAENKNSVQDTNAMIMEGINELMRLQREGFSLVDKG